MNMEGTIEMLGIVSLILNRLCGMLGSCSVEHYALGRGLGGLPDP